MRFTEEVARYCMRAEIVEAPKQREITSENKYEDEGKKPVKKSDEEKIGRNDPCPCGSGKKYKKCCGKGPLIRGFFLVKVILAETTLTGLVLSLLKIIICSQMK